MIIHTALYKKIEPKTPIILPTQSGSLTYTGGVQSPSWSGFYDNLMEISGTTSATNAGTYTVTFKLKDKKQYEWADGTQGNKSVTWTIGKATPSVSISPNAISLSMKNPTATVQVISESNGEIYFQSVEFANISSSKSGRFITFTLTEETNRTSINLSIVVLESENYNEAVGNMGIDVYPAVQYVWEKYAIVDVYRKPEDFVNTTTQLNYNNSATARLCNDYTVNESTGACSASGNYKDIASVSSSYYQKYSPTSDYEYAIVFLTATPGNFFVAKRKNLSGYWYCTKGSDKDLLQISPTTSEPTSQDRLPFDYCQITKTTGKGSEVIETVTSTSRNAYPDNGISGSYWYVYKGEEER